MIKTVETATIPTAVYMRLDHEARLLERLDLGGTRRVLWCGQRDRFFYVVQPHVEGEPLDQVLAGGPLTVPDCLALATGLLATLTAVHELGVLHRDIKPSNIIVRRDGTSLSAELVDFGLTRGGDLDREPAGTVRYIAPEAAGLITGVIDQRADLYSVGVVLFECLAGRPPFSGGTVGEVLRQHLNVPAPQLRSMGIAVPRSLEGVLQRLLAKDPAVRYQSAASARSDIDAIAAAIAAGTAEPSVTPGSHDRRHVLAEPAFVGRSVELRQLVGVLGQDGASAAPAAPRGGRVGRRQDPPPRRAGAARRPRRHPRPAGPGCRSGRPPALPDAGGHRGRHRRRRLGRDAPRGAPGPARRPGGRRGGDPPGADRPARPRRHGGARAGALRRDAQHRGPAGAPRRPGPGAPAGPRPPRRLPVGRHHDADVARPLAGTRGPRGRVQPRHRRLLPVRGGAGGPPAPLHGPHRAGVTAPVRARRHRGSVRVDGRARAPRGHHRRGAARRRQPVHGVRRPARHGRDGSAARHPRGLAGRRGPHGRRADFSPRRTRPVAPVRPPRAGGAALPRGRRGPRQGVRSRSCDRTRRPAGLRGGPRARRCPAPAHPLGA